ncbi:hypothetical protein ES332_D08G176100v1 [Gossypium tomentosum]|uniref:Uncharacterized protein n=1 Tax=Gossypium tomentosum TaxID=34277 RepID=A0A5D2JW89_GOSTO|nr:hypothetical protein ES332_D08G176100v1 [Gossypium tomentosum]
METRQQPCVASSVINGIKVWNGTCFLACFKDCIRNMLHECLRLLFWFLSFFLMSATSLAVACKDDRPMARDQMGICVPRMDRLIAMEMCHVYIRAQVLWQ